MTLAIFLISIILFIFLIGLCIGSFLNVVILRAFSNESIVYPGSKCPSCQTPLKWYHNIPVLSYLFLKGKCAFCKEPISAQYPIIELIVGILFVAVFFKFGISLNSLFMMVIVSLFVVLAATDIKEKIVFDFHTYALVIVGLIYNLFNIGHLYLGDKVLTLGHFSIGINNSLIASILGIITGIIIMELFARFGYLVAGMRAFGEGDTYIAAGLGAVFGYKYFITVLVYSFIIQIFLTIPVFIKKLYINKDYRTLVSFFVFFVLIFIMKYIDYTGVTNNFIIFGLMTLLLCIVGFYVCKRILGGLKNQENATYLPFGPAMVLGALIKIFLL
jgi:leader peptidase (prepilin peptidase) / N-methyltransferase